MPGSTYDAVRNFAQDLIQLQGGDVTAERIREQAAMAVRMLPADADPIDVEQLIRDLESRFSLWIGRGTVMEDNADHVPWLPARRAAISWDLWSRYRDYLLRDKGMEPLVVERLHDLTDDILQRLEDPRREGAWDRRGLVAGLVQSGKTGNYTGLICKALDAGYKLVVVLTGMHNSLRSQTQLRIDEGVIGIDTRRTLAIRTDGRSHRIGVGRRPAERMLVVNSLTTSAESGDFRRQIADTNNIVPGGNDPLILVVKKNARVLRNLHAWAEAVAGHRDGPDGHMLVRGVPLLLIDDEADVASINTRAVPVAADGTVPEDYEVSRINEAIRRFLRLFDQRAYVAYTATPFANVFIDPEGRTQLLGGDLFPSSFIVNLPTPSTYVGPAQVFGLRDDAEAGFEETPGLPIIRTVTDQDLWMPAGHRTTHVPPALPPSLREAVRVFLISCAARTARGQGTAHKSMLVHVTRFTGVQGRVVGLLRDELSALRNRLAYGDGRAADNLLDELRGLWERDFVPTTAALGALAGQPVEWAEVAAGLLAEAQKIQVKEVNGSAQDALEYAEHERDGLSLIAVGGDKLQRGLTLEGLSVSYFLRAAKMYDTLMQMGRWFGYRPGYLDLSRLYTTAELEDWYRDITLASEELRQEFDEMADAGMTPMQFGIRVRTHAAGLLITAANKLRTGTVVELSYSGDVSETIKLHKDRTVRRQNALAVERLIAAIGGRDAANEPRSGRFVWSGAGGQQIVDFLDEYRTHPAAQRAKSTLLRDYIRKQLGKDDPELTEWVVVLVSKDDLTAEERRAGERLRHTTLGGIRVGLTYRAPFPAGRDVEGLLAIRQLHSNREELLALTPDELDQARALPQTERAARDAAARAGANGEAGEPEDAGARAPSGYAARTARSRQRGLLLLFPLDHEYNPDREDTENPDSPPPIGVVFSFPESPDAQAIEYRVNNVYWDQEFAS